MSRRAINIENDVSEKDLELIFNSLQNLNKELNVLAKDIFTLETDKKIISKPSIFIFSVINRAISLNNGYLLLSNSDNYIASVNLLRLQADNCMRVYALSLVEDRAEFFDEVLKGKHIRDFKDVNGNRLTDTFLANELDKIFKGFKSLYVNTSGFIHLSNEHLYSNNDWNLVDDTLESKILINGKHHFNIAQKVDFSFNMLTVGQELYKLLKGYRQHVKDWLDNSTF